ncbi:unnamed protein product [Agarophyton chilense]
MSRAPSTERGANALQADAPHAEFPLEGTPLTDADATAAHGSLSSHEDSDDEDAEQPTDDQILEEIGLLYHKLCSSEHGASSALNAVLQGPYLDDENLATITGGIEMDAYAMNMALQSFGLSLQPVRSRRSDSALKSEHAFLCFHEQNWYAIRRFGVHWMHLRETLKRPFHVKSVELCLSQLQADGCDVYAVVGKLPPCSADRRAFWQVPFSWEPFTRRFMDKLMDEFLGGSLVVDELDTEDEMEELNRRFMEDLREAMAASQADVHPQT